MAGVFLWLPLLVVVVPAQVTLLSHGHDKGSALGSVTISGAFLSIIAAPLAGSLSDTCKHPLGRRRPFMIWGTALSSLALFVMSISPDLSWLSASFLVLSVANNIILAPYSALVPDVVPAEQRGAASAWLGGLSMLGYISSGFLTYGLEIEHQLFFIYMILIVVHAASAVVTIYFTEEIPLVARDAKPMSHTQRCYSFATPFMSHDFRVVFFTRFLMQLGILTVQEYLLFYLTDAIGPTFELSGVVVADNPSRAVSVLYTPVLIGGFCSSLIAGFLSDSYGGRRKVIVYASGILMALASVFFSVTRSFTLDMFLGLIFGIGFGAFSAIDWAMATDVLPHAEEFAKDMGIWSLAMVLPQVVATPIAGVLLDYFETVEPTSYHLGYSVVFMLAVVYYGLGTFFVKYIDSVS